MKYKVLMIMIFILSSEVYAQKEDVLENIKVPTRYYFNRVSTNKGFDKKDCTAIIFGLSRNENMVDYYNENWNINNRKRDYTLPKDSLDYKYLGKTLEYISKNACENPKLLRISNYRNTQSSLDHNVQDFHMGMGNLDSGEQCVIMHSIDMENTSRYVWIFVGENMNVKYSYSEY